MGTSLNALLALVLASAAGAAPQGDTDVQEAAFSTAMLAPSLENREAHLALIAWTVRSGRATDALAGANELLAADLDDALRARATAERDRIVAWIDLRDRFVGSLIESGKKITFDVKGEKLSTRLLSREGVVVKLDENKRKLESLSIEEIEPLQLAKLMGKGGAEFKGGYVRFYAYVLAQDKRWKKLLKDKSEAALAFRKDAEEYYPAALHLGEATSELLSMSQAKLPANATEGGATLERIEALRSRFGELPLVQGKRSELRGLAAVALAALFEAEGVAGALNGKVEELGADRVRITYDFSTKEQANDFTEDRDYTSSLRRNVGDFSEAVEPSMQVKKSSLRIRGSTCYRHDLWLTSPVSLNYDVEFLPKQGEQPRVIRFLMGILDDAKGSWVGSHDSGNLQVRDLATGLEDYAYSRKKERIIDFARVYDLELHHDEKGVATSFLDGEKQNELKCGPRRSGHVILWLHSELEIAISKLVIEAKIDEEGRRRVREDWIAKKLVELELD